MPANDRRPTRAITARMKFEEFPYQQIAALTSVCFDLISFASNDDDDSNHAVYVGGEHRAVKGDCDVYEPTVCGIPQCKG